MYHDYAAQSGIDVVHGAGVGS